MRCYKDIAIDRSGKLATLTYPYALSALLTLDSSGHTSAVSQQQAFTTGCEHAGYRSQGVSQG